MVFKNHKKYQEAHGAYLPQYDNPVYAEDGAAIGEQAGGHFLPHATLKLKLWPHKPRPQPLPNWATPSQTLNETYQMPEQLKNMKMLGVNPAYFNLDVDYVRNQQHNQGTHPNNPWAAPAHFLRPLKIRPG